MNDPYECDKCGKEFFNPHQLVTIPLDPLGFKLSGCFCSLQCARNHNRYMNGKNRSVFGWEQREQWMLEREKNKKNFDPIVNKKK
jgi:hypothetical protein